MVAWKSRVLLTDLHEAYQEGEMPIEEVAKQLAERLEKNRYHEDLEEEISVLREITDVDEYDGVLENLYDFGDYDHRIWFECL